MTKAELRARLRAARPDPDVIGRESRLVCQRLMSWDILRRARIIAAYYPMPGEADITPALRDILSSGKILLLPRTGRDGNLTFCRATSLEALEADAYGIPAPPPGAPRGDTIELMLLPLCGVDGAGHRLGHGAGCYDRDLAGRGAETLRVGVALSYQMTETMPADPWDQSLDACVCPMGIIEFTGREREP